jgi:hypothetical protein
MRSSIFLMVIVSATALVAGCSEERYDCRDICDTVQACMAVNIDVSECTNLCTSYAFSGEAAEAQAEACNECLDSTACGGAQVCENACGFVIAPID